MASKNKEQFQVKQQDYFEKSRQAEMQQTTSSEFAKLYEQIMHPHKIDPSIFLQKLHKNQISYAPNSAYQSFSYQVEKLFPSLGYYKMKIKIGHFTLFCSAVKICQSNILRGYSRVIRSHIEIYFINFNQSSFCLKSFCCKSQDMFSKLFPTVLKEWAILKICSAIECGPEIPNFIGFDLLIFDDCIQYAAEEGQKIEGFSQFEIKHLREQLNTMHYFKIVHLDIKPQNTIFSPHLKKPVFIDFGFSQIIKENLGQKTLTRFKGTPNYCSPGMLAIMLENEGYVDLYYNDAYSLQQLLYCKKLITHSFQQETLHQEKQATLIFSIYLFQYYYLQSNLQKSRQALHKCLKISPKAIKKVLIFIKETLKIMFLSEIFEKDLKSYQYMIEYREIEDQIKLNNGKFFYTKYLNQSKQVEEQESKSMKFELSSFATNYELTKNYRHYLDIILSLCKLESETVANYVSISFECVRFDKKNLQVNEKRSLSEKMNSLLLLYIQTSRKQFESLKPLQLISEQIQTLREIKLFFMLAFQFCFTDRCLWVKKHIFDVCQQLILLSTDFNNYIQRLAIFADQVFTQPKQQVLMVFQLLRFRNTVDIIETSNFKQLKCLMTGFDQLILRWTNKFNQSSRLSEDPQIAFIKQVFDLLQKKMQNNSNYPIQVEENKLRQINDSEIRRFMLLCLIRQKVDHYIKTMSPQLALEIIQFSKRSSDLRNLDLISSAIITIKILAGLKNFAGIEAYYNYIRSIINCDTICDTLRLRKKQEFRNPDICFIQSRIQMVIKLYQQQILYESMYCQVVMMFTIIDKNKLIVQDKLKSNFLEFYELYKRNSQIKKVEQLNGAKSINQFLNAFYFIQLQYQFYCFSDLSQDVFLNNLRISQQNFKQIAKQQYIQLTDKLKLVYCHFKMQFYRFHYYLHIQHFQKYIQCLDVIQQILQSLHLKLILLDIVKLKIKLAVLWQRLPLIESAVYKLYDICCQINFKSFYLIPKNVNQIFITLTIFQFYKQSLFYSLLNDLTLFLVSHPIEDYFQVLLASLDKFLSFNPSRGYALHFSKFLSEGTNSLKDNPYLLIFCVYSIRKECPVMQLRLFKAIIMNCDRLSNYAKRKLLQRCFGVYFEHLNCSSQQGLFNFRTIKNYLNDQKRRNLFQPSKMTCKNSSSALYLSIKRKLQCYRHYLA